MFDRQIGLKNASAKQLFPTIHSINDAAKVVIKEALLQDDPAKKDLPTFRLTWEERWDAKKILAQLLKTILDVVKAQTVDNVLNLPNFIIEQFEARLYKSQELQEQYEDLWQTLRSSSALEPKHLRLLNDIVLDLDRDRKLMFQKLRTHHK